MSISEWIYPKGRMTRALWWYFSRKTTGNVGRFGQSTMLEVQKCQIGWGVTLVPTVSVAGHGEKAEKEGEAVDIVV